MISAEEFNNNAFAENEEQTESRQRSTTNAVIQQENNDKVPKTPRRLTATRVDTMSAADVVFRGVNRAQTSESFGSNLADDDMSWAEDMFSEAENELTTPRSRGIQLKTTKITHSDIDWFSELEESETESATPTRKRSTGKKVKRKVIVKRKSTGRQAGDRTATTPEANDERSRRGKRTVILKDLISSKTPSRRGSRSAAPEEAVDSNRTMSKVSMPNSNSRPTTPNSRESASVVSDGSSKSRGRSIASEGSSKSRGRSISCKRSEMMMMASPRKRGQSRSQRGLRSTDFELPLKTDILSISQSGMRTTGLESDTSNKSTEDARLNEMQKGATLPYHGSLSRGCDLNQSERSLKSHENAASTSSPEDDEIDKLFKKGREEERKSILDKSRKGPINDYRSKFSREYGKSPSLRSMRSMRKLASDDDLDKLIKKAQDESWEEMPESPTSVSKRKVGEVRDSSRRRNAEEKNRRLSKDDILMGDETDRRGALGPKKSTEYLPMGLSYGQQQPNARGENIDCRPSPKGKSRTRRGSKQKSLDYSLDHLGPYKCGQRGKRLSSSASVQDQRYTSRSRERLSSAASVQDQGLTSRSRERLSSAASVPGDIKPSKGRSPTSVLEDGKPAKNRPRRVKKDSKDKQEWAGAIDDILHARRNRREPIADSPRSQRAELLAAGRRTSSSMHIRSPSNRRMLDSMKSSSMHSLGGTSSSQIHGTSV